MRVPAIGILSALLALAFSARAEQFARKECLDCHAKFADKLHDLKNLHAPVKSQKCEECHLRHGTVPKLLLKESGNALCLTCHKKESLGLEKKVVHPVLKTGKCTDCHDAHGSNTKFLLKREGKLECYSCHKPEPFEKKFVHKVVADGGCMACHTAHASDQKGLLIAAEGPLCLKCHAAEAAPFQKAHGGLPVASKACTTCHDPL